MSEASLRLIPANPWYVPDDACRAAARDWLAHIFGHAEAIRLSTQPAPQFIDAGENFGAIYCPETGESLSVDWWQAAMDHAWQGEGFGDLNVTLPTTGNTASLNDLVYEWPLGFARFLVEISAPATLHELTALQLRELGSVLRCHLRLIWRYA